MQINKESKLEEEKNVTISDVLINQEFEIFKNELTELTDLVKVLESKAEGKLLRWYISEVTRNSYLIEATVYLNSNNFDKAHNVNYVSNKHAVVNIIPTGIGCSVGGYAADATPANNLLASQVDYVITNPNTVNASNFINLKDNVLYTEGYLIDKLMSGKTSLYPVTVNKVGLIIEKTSKEDLDVVYNLVNAIRAIHGIEILPYVTKEEIGSYCKTASSGAYIGNIKNTNVLCEAAEYLINSGCTSIAVTTNVKDLPMDNYKLHFEGKHPNPVGGVEAIISHLIGYKYNVACAHAPMINLKEMNLDDNVVDARGAGEFSSESGLACILIGLSKAPSPSEIIGKMKDVVNVKNILAIIAPSSSLGSISIINALKNNIPVIAVKNNETILNVDKKALNSNQIIEVNNYLEASGVIQSLKMGISIESIIRPLETLKYKN